MLNLTAGGLSGGYRKYLQQLVPLLRREPAVSELLVVVPPGHQALLHGAAEVRTWEANEEWRGFPSLRRSVRGWRPDVVFVPTARWLDCGAPCVSMVRNMEPMVPRLFRGAGLVGSARVRAMGFVAKRAARRADRVIAVSHFVAEHLRERWAIPAGRIGVVYHGVDRTPKSPAPPAALADLAGRRFLLAAGSLLPYRGLEDAVAALPRLRGEASRGIPLVIAGGGSAGYRARVASLARSLGVADRVRWAGELDSASLAWTYEACSAFLMTSRVEACPNTALEAMAHGALCIATTCPPMPEFFASAARYYPAGETATLAARIDEALSASEPESRNLKQAAVERASQFDWADTARLTVTELSKT